MNIFIWDELDDQKKNTVLKRAETDISEQISLAIKVSEDVKNHGDIAVVEYTIKFDKVNIEPTNMKVTLEEIQKGYDSISPEIRGAIEYAAGNIKNFHQKQMPQEMWFTYVDNGLMVGEKITPIENVCLYVPRGKGSFPSVLLMLSIPAVVSKVSKIVIVTPPNEEGNVDDTLLAAAKIAGVSEIYKVGGIQAVAAVAHGTETIPKCRKIIGPGNSYVTAAKRALAGYIDAGLPAGPSEAIILADEFADPEKVALDWMIEAEHGPDSAALLVTHSRELIDKVLPLIEIQMKKISQKRADFIRANFSNYGGVILTGSLEKSIDFVNQYAPEHMEVLTKTPFDILPKIINAGEILLGEYSPITLCNFLLGPNAILPTGGFAKTHSGVSVHDFLKRSSIGYATKEGFENVRDKAYTFAKCEGFETHALAVKERK